MSRRDRTAALRDMLEHARETIALVEGKTRGDLAASRLLNLALVRLLEIIGEAARRVPEDITSRHTEIPWAEIVSLRNRLIHGYDSVDFDILWQIVTSDLPRLVVTLGQIIASESRE